MLGKEALIRSLIPNVPVVPVCIRNVCGFFFVFCDFPRRLRTKVFRGAGREVVCCSFEVTRREAPGQGAKSGGEVCTLSIRQ